jgi:hypothetical protein
VGWRYLQFAPNLQPWAVWKNLQICADMAAVYGGVVVGWDDVSNAFGSARWVVIEERS